MGKRSRDGAAVHADDSEVVDYEDIDDWLKVGSKVIVSSGVVERPFVADVVKVKKTKMARNKKSTTLVDVRWYYYPEDTKWGRRSFHGRAEVFESNHKDEIHLESIIDVCQVVGVDEYANNTRSNRPLFYQRFFYDAQREKFRGDAVSLHCVCNQPYNPDFKMIVCSVCGEKYHPNCIGLDDDEIAEGQRFLCSKECRAQDRG